MEKHVAPKRLGEIASKDLRLTEAELSHLEKCEECVDVYAKLILQAARGRAKGKQKGSGS